VTTNTNNRGATRNASPASRPPRRGLSWDTFQTLDGITPQIHADMAQSMYGDGYHRVGRETRAFMHRHNIAWVGLHSTDCVL